MNSSSEKHIRGFIRGVNRVISWIEVIVLALMLIFGLYSIWDNRHIVDEGSYNQYEMYKPTAKDTRNFDDFAKLNPDVCGWITIKDTGIDYPMVHGEDNDTYMNTTPDLKFALSGSIFLDSANASDFSDFNTIIYGHHMEGPSMFGGLDRFGDASFFKNHKYGSIFYNGHTYRLDIFAFLEVDAYDGQIYHICETQEEDNDYISYVMHHAMHHRNINVSSNDHIVVLSTCMTDETNGRYILTARIGKEITSLDDAGSTSAELRELLSPRMILLLIVIVAAVILIIVWIWRRYRQNRMLTEHGVQNLGAGSAPDRKGRPEKRNE